MIHPALFFKDLYNLLLKDIVDLYKLLSGALRKGILFLSVLMFCQAGTELLMIMSIRHLGMAPSDPSSLANEFPYFLLFGYFPNLYEWAMRESTRFLLLATVMVFFFVLLKNVVTGLTTCSTGKLSEKVSLAIGNEIMRRFLFSEYRWHLSSQSNQALQILMWRSTVANLLVQQLSALTGLVTCIILFIGMIMDEPKLSFSLMALMFSLGAALYILLKRGIDLNAKRVADAGANENLVIMATTRGIREVVMYAQQETFAARFAEAIEVGIPSKIFLLFANTLPTLVLETAGFLFIPLTVGIMMYWQASMAQIVSAVMLLVLTAWRVLPYLNRGVGQMVAIRSILPMARPVLGFLHNLRRNAQQEPHNPSRQFSFVRELYLKDVDFAYPENNVAVLKNINIVIPKGKIVGFIGQSGAGKSTCCNLISGLCPPSSGEFLVDGRAPDAEELAALKKRIGFVPQAPFLLAGTVAANVAFSEWGKPWDEEKVIRACRLAAVDFFPLDGQGILHPVGDNGAGLSGGQAQRISIARALYAEPEILIFDEATSALDAGNENIIVSSIERLRGSVTCVIIAHRLSTVERCDIIYWFENGTVVKSGPPESILEEYRQSFRKAGVEGAT